MRSMRKYKLKRFWNSVKPNTTETVILLAIVISIVAMGMLGL